VPAGWSRKEFNQFINEGRKKKPVRMVLAPVGGPRKVRSGGKKSGKSGGSAYTRALFDPFDRRSEGCKIPDAYAFPTIPGHIRGTYNFVAGTQTAHTFLFYPHPAISTVDLSVWTGSATSVGSVNGIYPANTFVGGATTPSAMNGIMGNFRLVAGGLKVRVQCPELARTGRLMVAPFPCERDLPGPNALGTVAMTNGSGVQLKFTAGVTSSIIDSSGILNLPNSREYSFNQLGQQEITLVFKPHSAACCNFHTTTTAVSYNATANVGDDVLTTAGAVTSIDSSDLVDMSGWNGWILHWEGVSTNNPVIDIEYVYHIEGTPQLSSTTTLTSAAQTLEKDEIPFEKVLHNIKDMGYIASEAVSAAGNGVMGAVQIGAAIARALHQHDARGRLRINNY